VRLRSPLAALVLAIACGRNPDSGKIDTAQGVSSAAVNTTPIDAQGMTTRVRWQLSPDKSAILVMIDPSGVEGDAIPNSFFFGSEPRNFQIETDSVWDVAVSPDWSEIAYSRAHIVRGSDDDSIPAAIWSDLSKVTGLDSATLRTSSFPTSGMSSSRGIAQPAVIRIPSDARVPAAVDSAKPKVFPIALGWRLRWTADGTALALGANPARANDEENSVNWAELDPRTGSCHTSLPAGTRLAEQKWTEGPVLDVSVPIDLSRAPEIFARAPEKNYTIASERGVITIRESDKSGPGTPVGAGIALAATAGGRFILAIAPRSKPQPGVMPLQAVVYTVGK
jgi:hypothetical protein